MFDNRLVLVESLTSSKVSNTHSELHLLDIKPLPLGIVTSVTKSTISVAVSGTVKVSTTLAPGYNYYGDNDGHLHKGEFVGSMNTDIYYVYVETEDNKILSDDNRVGFALDEETLFLKVHN